MQVIFLQSGIVFLKSEYMQISNCSVMFLIPGTDIYKHCRHPITIMGVVDTFRLYFLCWLKSCFKVWYWNGPGLKIGVGKTGVEIFCNHSSLKILTKNSPSLMRTPSITYSGWKLQDTTNFWHASTKLWNNWKRL